MIFPPPLRLSPPLPRRLSINVLTLLNIPPSLSHSPPSLHLSLALFAPSRRNLPRCIMGRPRLPDLQGLLPVQGLSEPPDQVCSSRTSACPAGSLVLALFSFLLPPRLHLSRAANQTQQGVRKVRKRRRRQMEVKEAAGAAAIRVCL